MIDVHLLRNALEETERKLKGKDPDISLAEVAELDEKIRDLKQKGEELKAERNALSKEVGEKKRAGEDANTLMINVGKIGEKIKEIDAELKNCEASFHQLFDSLPNLPADDVKVALDPKENVCVKSWGEKPQFSFEPKHHLELSEKLDILDFERGAKLAGRGFPVYNHKGALIEWALLNYMIDIHIKNGFEMRLVPYMAKPDIVHGSGQLPKFESQLFKIQDDDFHLYLLPTSEVALNGLHYKEILDDLPKKYMSITPCFRREAGAAGEKERGLIRVHQFNKVEMFAFTKPEESDAMFDHFVSCAEEILEGLELHHRNMLLVTGDMSFAARKTVDMEVWLPGQNRYYEVSSISNCSDFQARRSQIRFKREQGAKPELVHTLNGSGLATARLLVALLENNQKEDGTIPLPKALHPYLHGMTHVKN